MEINYIGGKDYNVIHKETLRRFERYLATQKLVPVPGYSDIVVDVDNMFARKFMCCSKNCDFYMHVAKRDGLFGGSTVEFVDKSCCYGGSLMVEDSVVSNIDKHLDGILELCDTECAEHIRRKGWKRYTDKAKENVCVNALPKDNRCLFTFVEDGMPMCALHRYALNVGMDVYTLKPFECSMFPMEFIEVDGTIILTAIDPDGRTQGLLRWGDVHLGNKCMHHCEDGEPMYQYSRTVIVKTLGQTVYDALDAMYKAGDWK